MQKLETAFQKIDALSANEKEVSINDQKIILGVVDGADEERIQAYVMNFANLKKLVVEKEAKIPMFLRDMKVETVVYAIKAINGERLDKVDFFSVSDPKGGPDIKIERQIFLRRKLKEWPPFIYNYLFNQYISLVNDTTKVMEPKFEFEGLEDLVQEEIKTNQEAFENITNLAKESEVPSKKEPVFRKIETPEGGVLDQTGH